MDWLAEYLFDYPHAFVVISHDTWFLERVVKVVFRPEHQALTWYPTGFANPRPALLGGNRFGVFRTVHICDEKRQQQPNGGQ